MLLFIVNWYKYHFILAVQDSASERMRDIQHSNVAFHKYFKNEQPGSTKPNYFGPKHKIAEQSKQYTPDAINSALVNKYMKLTDGMTTTGKKIPP